MPLKSNHPLEMHLFSLIVVKNVWFYQTVYQWHIQFKSFSLYFEIQLEDGIFFLIVAYMFFSCYFFSHDLTASKYFKFVLRVFHSKVVQEYVKHMF